MFEGQWPTIIELLLITEKKFGLRNGFTIFRPTRQTLTYSEILAHVKRIGSYLMELGVKKGDRVIVNGKNSPAWALAYLATHWAGAVVVPLDNQMLNERVENLSSFVEASFFFADRSVLDALDKSKPWFENLKGYACLNDDKHGYSHIDALVPSALHERVVAKESDLAAILFTSGTTGNEKGAMLTHANIISDLYQACDTQFLWLDETAVLYALLPLHHSYCCTAVLLESIKFGAECVFGQDIAVSRMIGDMTQGKVTIFMGIPLLYNKILAGLMKQVRKKGLAVYALVRTMMVLNGFFKKYFHLNLFRKTFNKMMLGKIGLDRNHFLICGAGPLSPKVFKQYQMLGLDFIQGYGLTETSPILTLNPIKHFKVDSVGKVLPLVDMIIADPDSNGVGEVRVKGPNITVGYYKDIEHTTDLFDEQGYLRTGDLGYLDKDNYLYLKGRLKNIIVTEGGKNVYPEEIEDMFQLYQQVEQILIRGYQEDRDVPAEMIEAAIYPSQDYYKEHQISVKEDLDRIIKEVNKNLVGYKKITRLTIVDKPMAMTSTKKIKRNKVTA